MMNGAVIIKGFGDWWEQVLLRFGFDEVNYSNGSESCTALRHPAPNSNIMIGRYCKIKEEGYILDRRATVRPTKI
jgi:hypothetical protein